ncbi:MAG: hypothetical protein IPL27_21510 [Lewinellaceae bacterium]|nr:hypothetical protein [Lewinellaceae bacterium]
MFAILPFCLALTPSLWFQGRPELMRSPAAGVDEPVSLRSFRGGGCCCVQSGLALKEAGKASLQWVC